MKKVILYLMLPLLLTACRKNSTLPDSSTETVRGVLESQLSKSDQSLVEYSTMESARLSNGHQFYRLKMGEEFVVLDLTTNGEFVKGNIYSMSGKVTLINRRPTFNGLFHRSTLARSERVSYSIEEGFVKELHTFSNVTVNSIGPRVMKVDCSDCTLPEVIVSTSYPSTGGISWSTWMSILAMFNMGGQSDFLSYDFSGGGGGGGGSAAVISVDTESPENKNKIDPKKYTDCFGTVPDNSTTLYTVTISADLPVDGHPEIFYDWSSYSPGHVFIELNKSTPYGGVAQNIGFYPSSAKKFVILENSEATTTPKIVDNGGHEYNARYTISVTSVQFQAAIDNINSNSTNLYNVGLYNCTDFALGVFNAAGGNLSIPRYPIPGFEVTGGSNTPQGLFNQIQSMKNNGVSGTNVTNNKEYAGASKGPCN